MTLFMKISPEIQYMIIFAVFVKLGFATIHLKPVEANEMDDTSEIYSDRQKYMFIILPHNLLRSEMQSHDAEPHRSLNEDLYNTNGTDSEIIEGLKLNRHEAEMLRKSWRDSCDKKAAKTCRKACINTYKIVCSAYLCKKSMKRSFKRECKRNCRGRFVSSKTDSE